MIVAVWDGNPVDERCLKYAVSPLTPRMSNFKLLPCTPGKKCLRCVFFIVDPLCFLTSTSGVGHIDNDFKHRIGRDAIVSGCTTSILQNVQPCDSRLNLNHIARLRLHTVTEKHDLELPRVANDRERELRKHGTRRCGVKGSEKRRHVFTISAPSHGVCHGFKIVECLDRSVARKHFGIVDKNSSCVCERERGGMKKRKEECQKREKGSPDIDIDA